MVSMLGRRKKNGRLDIRKIRQVIFLRNSGKANYMYLSRLN